MATVTRLLLLSFFSYYSLIAYAGDDPSYTIGTVKTEAGCSEPKAIPSSGGTTVALHHRRGPCSLLPTKKLPSLEEILRSDQMRARYIQRKLSAATNGTDDDAQKLEATLPTTLGMSLDTLEYVVTVGVGTPAVKQTMIMDTGSDVSWVNCQPCSQCHAQADPLFDPSRSSTYSPFSCGASACAQLGQDGGCSTSQQCLYRVKYGDGSNTTGTYGADTLTLGSNVIKGFQFGCSRVESGFDDKAAGLVGLGGDVQSLVSQTAGTFGTAFSYCLPPPSSSSGFLTLGASSTTGRSNFTTTRMYRLSQVPTFYFVLLQAIRVGGRQINVQPSVFSAGSVMDSGTIITWLPPTAYAALSSAFRAGMTQYPRAQARGILDTCFDFSGQSTVRIPAVSLVFAGPAVVNLDFEGIMSGSCLAFAANGRDSAVSIIGNVQQRTFEVLYDVGRSAVGFRPGAC